MIEMWMHNVIFRRNPGVICRFIESTPLIAWFLEPVRNLFAGHAPRAQIQFDGLGALLDLQGMPSILRVCRARYWLISLLLRISHNKS
jgi:hypothetical protein